MFENGVCTVTAFFLIYYPLKNLVLGEFNPS